MHSELKYNPKELSDFAKKHRLMLVILYGSRATDSADEESDWDIAAAPEHGTFPDLIPMLGELCAVFGMEPDIGIVTSRSDPLYRWEVYRTGKPLYEDEPGRFDEEYRVAWHIYMDTEKFRRLEREIIEEKY